MAVHAPVKHAPSTSRRAGGKTPAPGGAPAHRAARRSLSPRKLWRQARTTLKGSFVLLAGCIGLLALIQTLLVAQLFQHALDDLNTISRDSIPSVDAAQVLANYVEDIDAKAAGYLATAGFTAQEPCTIPGVDIPGLTLTVHDCDDHSIAAEITLANKELYLAAHNVTYPGERTAIERIELGLQVYISNIRLMQYEYGLAESKTDPRDPHLAQAYASYQVAGLTLRHAIFPPITGEISSIPTLPEPSVPDCVLDGRTIPGTVWPLGSLEENIDCLNNINRTHLDSAYADATAFLGVSAAIILGSCLLLCGLLLLALWRMAKVTHRVINPGLGLAALVGVIFCFGTVLFAAHLAGTHGAFGQITVNAYGNVSRSAQLERYLTTANADESRWLIAVEFSDQESMFAWSQDWLNNVSQVNDLLHTAFANQSHPEEAQLLQNMQANWDRFYQIDAQIRQTASNVANPNRVIDAERLSTGDSNTALAGFVQEAEALAALNRSDYNQALASTRATLTQTILLSYILFPLIGLAAVWGIARRLKEF